MLDGQLHDAYARKTILAMVCTLFINVHFSLIVESFIALGNPYIPRE